MAANIPTGPDGRAPKTARKNVAPGAAAGSQPQHVEPTPAWWAQQLLARLGFPRSAANMQAVEAWEAAEGGHWNNTARFNPLNTSQPMLGSTPYKPGAGVQSYTSWEQGLDATVKTLRNGRYGGILDALKGSDTQAFSQALVESPWDHGHYNGHFDVSGGAGYANTTRAGDAPVPSSGPIPAAAQGGADVSTAGGGSALPADASPADIDSYIESNYGYLAAFLKNPAIAPLLEYAAKNQLSADAIKGLLTDTSPGAKFPQAVQWYEHTSQTARQFDADAIQDPATHQQQIAQQTATVTQEAHSLGVPVAGDVLAQIAVNSLRYGWSSGQIQTAIAAHLKYQAGTNYGGTVGKSLMDLNQQAANYLVPVSQPTLGKWVQQIAAGTMTSDDFTTFLQQQAANLYPTISSALKGGMTTKDYLDPYMQIAQSTLERQFTPNDFMTNPQLMKALNTTTPDGQRAPMSLADWQTYLRGLPQYQQTQQAKSTAQDYADTLAKTFGKVAV